MVSCAAAGPLKCSVPSAMPAAARAKLRPMTFIGISRCGDVRLLASSSPEAGARCISCGKHHCDWRIGAPPDADKLHARRRSSARPLLPQAGDDLVGHGLDLFVLVAVGHEDDAIDAGGQMGL